MTSEIDKSHLQRIAKLAALKLDESELAKYSKALSDSFAMIDKITQIDTSDTKPMAHPLHTTQRLREDTVSVDNKRDELLACAPESQAGLLLVPQVIE